MSLFLLVYDQLSGALGDIEVFEDSDSERALARRFALEQEHLGTPAIEVIVLSAADRESLMRTHSRYFKGVSELASSE